MDLTTAAEAFLISFVLVAPFIAFLKPRPLSLAGGAVLVAVGALGAEYVVQAALNPLYAGAVVLVLAAPAIEELLKFGISGATGANFASASGAGIGFAATENALYFLAAWGEPAAQLVVLIVLRAITDPLLHSTSTTLTTLTWHGRPWGLPAGLALHMAWNTVALIESFVDPAVGIPLLILMTIVVLIVLRSAHRNEEIRETLDDRWRMNLLTGDLHVASPG